MRLSEAQRLGVAEIRPHVRRLPMAEVRLDKNLDPDPFFATELNLVESVLSPRGEYPPVFVRWDGFCRAYFVVRRQAYYVLARRRGESTIACVEVEPDAAHVVGLGRDAAAAERRA